MTLERFEQKEMLSIGRELSPAEYHFFIGSSTLYKGTVVNTDSMPHLLKDKDFLQYFLTPLYLNVNRAISDVEMQKLNNKRLQGLLTQLPIFLPIERWKEFLNLKMKIQLPYYDFIEKKTEPKWIADVFDNKGYKANLNGIDDITSSNPYLAIRLEKESSRFIIEFNPSPYEKA